ncbi:MAG: hypothetical protein COB37_06795 [Kordiimonadales bacterium]|nr:MAG: hypothetical protein COB37_06795 [Kordiimonadales bacterium]
MRKFSELSQTDILVIKSRLKSGDQVQEIARDFDINLGRVSEIKTGKRASHVPALNQGELGL